MSGSTRPTSNPFRGESRQQPEWVPPDEAVPQEGKLGVSPTHGGTALHTQTDQESEHPTACFEIALTSDTTSYTVYLFKMNPCNPRRLTWTVDWFLHQPSGSPLPATTLGPPLGEGSGRPVPPRTGRAVFHGSSELNEGARLGTSRVGF